MPFSGAQAVFDKVLIANRGAIACRIIRTLKKMGIASVAVYSKADAGSRHVMDADEAICIGEALASDTYLDVGKILETAIGTGAQAIHPGYGFLSENASFAEACRARGIAFVGPTPRQMRAFGLKHTARELAEQAGVPLLPGTGLLGDVDEASREAACIGYPVMLKSTAGGGGIGMQLCREEAELRDAFASVQRLGRNNFADAGIFLEKYVEHARHIEVQIFGDGHGSVVALGERDCSLQRRNQKVVEETPAPNLPEAVRQELWTTARRLGESVNYRSAGTVEYIVDADSGAFYFLEVNTRLQVEHGVTEQVTGVDLVEWMIRLAAGEVPFPPGFTPQPTGHSIQVRLYAEDPAKGFQPSSGLLTEATFPEGVRSDTWVEAGIEVPPFYDPMLAKLIVHAGSRDEARRALKEVLAATRLSGIETNLAYLRQVVDDPVFAEGRQTTRHLGQLVHRAPTVDVLSPGTQTTVQDFPGRTGYWDVGVPPSGPMDDYAFRLANRLVGNPEGAAGLELTVTGPALRFNLDTVIAFTGAPMQAMLDDQPLPLWQPVQVPAGSRITLGKINGGGARAYLAVRGGLDVPEYLGSRSTFTLGQFGGHAGRPLRTGDVLHVLAPPEPFEPEPFDPALVPAYANHWTLRVIYGPHGAPDFFTDADIERFFATDWEVHYNSSRTGVRLIGPKPEWARPDGGEAGLHPSNIHDNAYAIGTIDFTGDMPVILGPDGPSLGGFVCPATLVRADLWITGQLRPGDKLRFVPIDQAEANRLEAEQAQAIARLQAPPRAPIPAVPPADPVIRRIAPEAHPVGVVYRPSGDKYLLVEYGPLELDINLRFRVHALMLKLAERWVPGIEELTPGIRSLQVHYDSRRLPLGALLDLLAELEAELEGIEDLEVPARIVHLPLAWDDSQTRRAIAKYEQSVRKDAPWCPSNIEFIRRINGLSSVEAVKRIVFDASYLVMGLGDVYLGAPVATPMDPRHRLVTTKYNPARTWTPENAVGIGGSYLCVYGMEGPGGYQFVGRTLQMWNRYRRTPAFEQPWLLRFFDQVRFYETHEEELLQARGDFPRGRFDLQIEQTRFRLRDYNRFLADNAESIRAFKTRQQAAFEAERERWKASGQARFEAPDAGHIDESAEELRLAEGEVALESHVHGSVWQVEVREGDSIHAGQVAMVLESMKMEISLHAGHAGRVARLLASPGSQVSPGQPLLVIDTRDNGASP
jgi:urea carboxylase